MQTTAHFPTIKAIAICAALVGIAAPAHAAEYWSDGIHTVEMPPAEFRKPMAVPPVEIHRPLQEIYLLCGGGSDLQGCDIKPDDGRAYFVATINATPAERAILDAARAAGQHVIVLPISNDFNISAVFVDHLRIHETGHAEGWVHQ